MSMTLSGSGTITGLSAGGLPDATIVQADLAAGVAGNGPAFSAYQSSAQSVSNATWTKIQFQTEEFDKNNNFDNATNYRFTPTVAGYYQVNGGVYIPGFICMALYKNGSEYKRSAQAQMNGILSAGTVSTLVYLNGSTDYVEAWVYQGNGNTQSTANSQEQTYFNGALVRAA